MNLLLSIFLALLSFTSASIPNTVIPPDLHAKTPPCDQTLYPNGCP